MNIDIDINNNVSTIDMLLLSIPWWDMQVMPCGPSVLKGITSAHGFNLKILDCNSILKYNFCNGDQTKFLSLENYFCFASNHQPELITKYYNYIIDHIVDLSNRRKIKFIGISVFSVYTQKAALDIINQLKHKLDIPIVVGGRGLTTKSNISIHKNLSPSEKLINFSDILKKRKLVNYVIEGDGEDSIIDLLSGNFDNTYVGKYTNKSTRLEYPFSNFDDYNFDHYKQYNTVQLPVISSKGCVRSCDFCDVAAQMAKFQSKEGTRLAEEMIFLSNKYNVTEFASADSIGNGNLKELRKTVSALIEYNNKVEDSKKIQWTANWICRPRNSIKADFFDLLKQSGCKSLTIGAEHGSDRVLEAMDKKTNVDGFHYEMEQLDRVGIQFGYNNIIAHWSEEFVDFVDLIKLWIRTGKYIANRTVSHMHVSIFAALDNTPATNNNNLNQLVRADDNFTLLWYSKKNPTLTLKTRLIRYLILLEISIDWNFPIENIASRIILLNDYISNDDEILRCNNFFESVIDPEDNIECIQTQDLSNNIKFYTDQLISESYPTTELVLMVSAESVNGNPCLQIIHCDTIVYEQDLPDGNHEIKLQLLNNFQNTTGLKFRLTNKGLHDTLVNDQGAIIKDKCIKFEKIILDGIDLLSTNVEFYYKYNSSPGLYSSESDITIPYEAPFWKHFLKNTPNYANWDNKRNIESVNLLIQDVKRKINLLKY